MKKDKTQVFSFFKKLTKVYDDTYVAKGIAEHLCFFKQKKGEQSILDWLNTMEKERLDAVGKAVKQIYVETNKDRRPFVACGNFAINFNEVVDVLEKIYQKRQ